MTLVTGDIRLVTDSPAAVSQAWLRAPNGRVQDTVYVTESPDTVQVTGGTVSFDALPGALVMTLASHGAPMHTVKLLVPDKTSATLAECIEAAELATDGTRSALERLALEVQAELGQVPSLVSDALAQDSTIIEAVKQASAVSMYTGTGSPEGEVAAPVGSIYTDSAATNGAIRWIKTSGTGSTGWAVEYGDTGWRDMSAQVTDYVSGSLYVKRSADLIYIHLNGLEIAPETNPFWFALFTLPEGMRPQRTIHARMELGAGSEPGDRYIAMNLNGEFRLNYPQNHTGAMWGYMTFPPEIVRGLPHYPVPQPKTLTTEPPSPPWPGGFLIPAPPRPVVTGHLPCPKTNEGPVADENAP